MSDIHINRAGQNLGIFSQSEVQTGLDNARFLGSDLAWRAGMENWKPLSQWADMTVPEQAPPLVGLEAGGALALHSQDLPSWEQKSEIGFLNAFGSTAKEVLTEPAETFSRMKETGGFSTPFLYMLISTGLGTALALGVQFGLQGIMGSAMAGQNAELSRLMASGGFGMIAGGALGFLIFFPVALFVFSFIGSGLWHLSLMILGGAKKPFEATYRVYCYATGATSLVSLVPFCGGLVAVVWKIVAGAIGLSKVHEVSTGKAVLAILMPLFLCCGLCLAGVISLYSSLAGNPEFLNALKGFNIH